MNETLSTLNLVKHYFNICNTALSRHRNESVLGTAFAALDRYASGETIKVTMLDNAGNTSGCYTTRYVDGEFIPVMEGDPDDPDARLVLRREFVEDVVENADDYIANPQKLDWSWLTDA